MRICLINNKAFINSKVCLLYKEKKSMVPTDNNIKYNYAPNEKKWTKSNCSSNYYTVQNTATLGIIKFNLMEH